ncbi:aspartyl protease family protein [Candidatus Rariloculus sp.]|uniref:aspartyl protease family protein n=1 Tax=Candidatus Rariloculus sp. TaxID=3101265 RepID=UPI003D09DE15
MEQVRKALFTTLAVLLCGCMRTLGPEGALTVVPYELTDSGRILVDVLIDGRGPFTFALDTAASISLVFEDPDDEFGLEPVPTTSAIVRGLVASGRYPVVRADRLQVGSEVWLDPTMVAVPGNTAVARSAAGILGVDFLRRYGLWFSAQDRALRLYPPDGISDRSYRGWAAVPLEPVNIGAASEPLYFFDIEIGGRTMPALFDLGAGANLINAPAAQFLRLAPVDSANELELAGALETAPILARLQSEMTTANVRWRNVDLLIADLEIFATLLHEDRPLAILGSGLFNQRDFVIDFVRNRLLVSTEMDELEPVR